MKIKVVFDTNIYVATALKPGGPSDMWLDIAAVPESQFELYASEPILREVRQTLLSTKFDFTATEVDAFVDRVRAVTRVVQPAASVNAVADDPDDDAIVECAVAARAHLVVSADPHLLKLEHFRGIGFAHPRELKRIFAQDLGRAG